MKKLLPLFALLAAVFVILLWLTLRQPAPPISTAQVARYSPSAIPPRPAGSAERFDFVAYGDSRNGHEIHRKLIAHMVSLNPDLAINTGDLVNRGRNDKEWDAFIEIITPLAEKIPYYTIRGNHDKGKRNYERRFAPPNDSGTDLYYAFDYKNAHFVGLDTSESVGTLSPQRYWLDKDLSATQQPHIIVFFHHPPFGVAKGRGDNERIKKAFHDLFVKHGVNLVLAGHDHLYYRTQRDGVMYVTTGGGGAPLHDIDEMLPRLANDVWGKYNHLAHLTVTGGLIKGTVIDVDGNIRDSFTVASRRQGRNNATDASE
jgi:predicted phosphodiesterase